MCVNVLMGSYVVHRRGNWHSQKCNVVTLKLSPSVHAELKSVQSVSVMVVILFIKGSVK